MLSIFSLIGFVGTMFGQSSVNHRLYYRDFDFSSMSIDNVRRDDTNGDALADYQTTGTSTQFWEATGSGLQLVGQAPYSASWSDAMKWGDFNNDGIQDLLYGDYAAQMFIAYGESSTTLSSSPVNIGELDMNAWGSSCYGASTGDYNGDGWLDVVGQGPNMPIFLFTNNQDGTFTRSQVSPLYSNRYSSWSRPIDWDNDGDLDMLAVVYEGMALYTNEGGSVFTETILFAPSHYLEVVGPGVTMDDIDNDGDLDFLVSGNSGTYVGTYPEGYTEWYGWSSIFVNNANTFSELEVIPYNSLASEFETLNIGGNYYYTRRLGNKVRIEDLNNDGYKDLISTTSHSFTVSVFYGGPDLTFSEQIFLSNNSAGPGGPLTNALCEDLTGDGILDFVVKQSWWTTTSYLSQFERITINESGFVNSIYIGGNGNDFVTVNFTLSDAANGSLTAYPSSGVTTSVIEGGVQVSGLVEDVNLFLWNGLYYNPAFTEDLDINVTVDFDGSLENYTVPVHAEVYVAPNTAPWLTCNSDTWIHAGDGGYAIWAEGSDNETLGGELQYTFSSSDESVISNSNISYSFPYLFVNTTPGIIGATQITVTVSDGELTNNCSFNIYTYDNAPNIEGGGYFPIECAGSFENSQWIYIWDSETNSDDLQLNVISYNDELVPSSGVSFERYGTDVLAHFTIADGVYGFANVEIQVLDAQGQWNSTWFTFEKFEDTVAPEMSTSTPTLTVYAGEESCNAVANWTEVYEEIQQPAFGVGSSYITNFYDGTFYAAINATGVSMFGVDGNIGADGNGTTEDGMWPITTEGGNTYNVFWQIKSENGYDPGIHKLIFVDPSQSVTSLSDYSNSDDLFTINGLSGENSLFYYMFGARSESGSATYSEEEMFAVANIIANMVLDPSRIIGGESFSYELPAVDYFMSNTIWTLRDAVLNNGNQYYIQWEGDLYYDSNDNAVGIGDGGYDMYDGGNYIITNNSNYYQNESEGIAYTFGEVVNAGSGSVVSNEGGAAFFGEDASYITNFVDGTFFAAVNDATVPMIGIDGNIGADGSGSMNYGSWDMTAGNGTPYRVFWQTRSEDSWDPAIHKLYFVDPSQELSVIATGDNNDDQFFLEGFNGQPTSFMYFLFGGYYDGSSVYSESDMQNIAQVIMDGPLANSITEGYAYDLNTLNSEMQNAMYGDLYTALDNGSRYYIQWEGDLETDNNGVEVGINDGGEDMYDGGNFLVTSLNNYYNGDDAGIPYTNGTVASVSGAVQGDFIITMYDGPCGFDVVADHTSGSTFELGITTVNYTLTDAAGNVSNYSFDVEVLDNLAPVAVSQNITVTLDQAGTYTMIDDDIDNGSTDNCGIVSYVASMTTFNLDNIGENSVELIVTDNSGNSSSAFATVTVQAVWYLDADGDGHHVSSTTLASNPGAGYSLVPGVEGDCDDADASVYQTVSAFVDADNDGYGTSATASEMCIGESLPAGYIASSLGVDCNDSAHGIHPGATEICGNSIDEDCDGVADDGCLVVNVANDSRSNAQALPIRFYPQCQNILGSLIGATVSEEAFTIAPENAGQDVWYRFVAMTNGVRIACSSGINNIVLELQNSNGSALITSENETAAGQEILMTDQLTAGQVYYILVRNFNTSAQGNFFICLQHFAQSSPDNGYSFSDLCSNFKCDWVTAQNYTVRFENDGSVYTSSGYNTVRPFTSFNGLEYNTTYTATIDASFILPDAAGNIVTSVIHSSNYYITIGAHNDLDLSNTYTCSTSSRLLNSWIASDRFVCGMSEMEWEFTPVNGLGTILGEPIYVESNAVTKYLQLNTINIPGIAPGNMYQVKVRPIFTSGPGSWGTDYQMLCIAGASAMETQEGLAYEMNEDRSLDTEVGDIYPNPNNGEWLNIHLEGIEAEMVNVVILDGMGRVVWSNAYATNDGTLNVSTSFEKQLASGLYMVEFVYEGQKMTRRLVVND
jgi:hypothetical protein